MSLRSRTRRLPVLPSVLGVTDGVLNALALAAGAILRGRGDGLDVDLAVRVGIVALLTAGFTLFVADYAERRAHLVRASKELNLTEPGRLAATNLGRAVARESAVAAGIAAIASFIGATIPLLMGALLPVPPWVSLAIAIALLGLLGWGIGSMLGAHPVRWGLAMLAGGVVVTVVGAMLDIA